MENPKIRFKGFTKDWEQRKFSELYARSSEKNDGSIGMDKNITVATMQFKNDVKVSTTEYLKTYYTFKLGDIAFEGHQSKEFRYGRFVENDIGNGIVSHIFAVFRPIQEYDLYFWKYAINNETLMQRILARSTKASTMMHDLVTNDFLNETFLVPSVKEQKQIGAFLNKLDNIITLHQRKCEQTKKLKKYMLQKMFPENGNCVPKIRFSGFADAWEQRKLGEVAQEFKSGNSLKADEIDITGDYPVYGGNGLRGYTSTYNHDGEYALIGRQGALCGNMNYSVGKAYFTEHAVVVKADENNDTRFLYYMLDTMNLGQYSDQSAQPGLAVNKLVKLENQFPMKEEQQRIGWYFSNIDHLITLHQHKCDELQKLKKFMLQNMFV